VIVDNKLVRQRMSNMVRRRMSVSESAGFDRRRTGVVLLAVLVVVTLLALAAYQYAELMTAELKATDSAKRAAQARALAASGIHYTAALLADRDSFTSRLGSGHRSRLFVKPALSWPIQHRLPVQRG
jgi:hypothetical protein